MTFRRLSLKHSFALASFASTAAALALFAFAGQATAQSFSGSSASVYHAPDAAGTAAPSYSASLSGAVLLDSEGYGSMDRPMYMAAGGASDSGGKKGGYSRHYPVAPDAEWAQPRFSRMGIGADVSPLGIGIKSALVLSHDFDARLMGNFFGYTSPDFEVEGFHVTGNLHMASIVTALDWYPYGSVFRISPGLMLYNGNQISGTTQIVPGTSFTINNQTFYSATANAATGATPLTGSGVFGLHNRQPAFTLSGGFGRFIPRSNRHWSFPAEFGVAFTGAPTIAVNASGWACLDEAQKQCSDLSASSNPVATAFNTALNAQLAKWRVDLNKVTVYPLFSYGVMYSFNIR